MGYFGVNILRAYRLYYIMETQNVFFIFLNVCLLHNFFNNIMPAKLGELSFPYLSKKKIYIPYRESLSSLFLSRMMDIQIKIQTIKEWPFAIQGTLTFIATLATVVAQVVISVLELSKP